MRLLAGPDTNRVYSVHLRKPVVYINGLLARYGQAMFKRMEVSLKQNLQKLTAQHLQEIKIALKEIASLAKKNNRLMRERDDAIKTLQNCLELGTRIEPSTSSSDNLLFYISEISFICFPQESLKQRQQAAATSRVNMCTGDNGEKFLCCK